MNPRVVTPPAEEPISILEAKQWLRASEDDTSQDFVILLLIRAMTKYAENLTGRAFIQRQLEYTLDTFPIMGDYGYPYICLPFPPVLSVDYVTYTDADSVSQTLNTSPLSYQVDTQYGLVWPLSGESWPAALGDTGSVQVGYTAGYGGASLVPDNLKVWLHARLATLYEHREQMTMNNMMSLPRDFADGLLDDLIVGKRLLG